MKYLRFIGALTVVFLTVFVMSVEAAPSEQVIRFSSLNKNQSYNVSGTLYMPENSPTPCPAVVVVHGTSGIDSRGEFYRASILNLGIAFFEVNFMTGIYTTPANRPQNSSFVPLAFAALKELQKIPAIDSARIGIMGFSLGGGVTLRTAVEKNRALWMGTDKGFASHVAFYPASKGFINEFGNGNNPMTGAPMIIFYGTEDSYGDGSSVPALKRLLLEKYQFEVLTVEYAGTHHGFNRNGPPLHYNDPASTGGKGYIAWDAKAANDSRTQVVDFLRKTLLSK